MPLHVVHKQGINLNFALLCTHMLQKSYGGPFKNIQHLYLYGSVIVLNIGCAYGVCTNLEYTSS